MAASKKGSPEGTSGIQSEAKPNGLCEAKY